MQSRTHLDMKMIDGMRRAIDRGAARQQPLKAEVHDLSTLLRDFEPMLARAGNRATAVDLKLQAHLALSL